MVLDQESVDSNGGSRPGHRVVVGPLDLDYPCPFPLNTLQPRRGTADRQKDLCGQPQPPGNPSHAPAVVAIGGRNQPER